MSTEALNSIGAKEGAETLLIPIPNKETIAAMRAARNGKLVDVGTIDNLLDDLNPCGLPEEDELPAHKHLAQDEETK